MQLWRLLEDRNCLAGVASEWSRWLGCDPSIIARWLRPREDLARSLPVADGRWLRIVEHSEEDCVGIDDDAGTSVAVSHEDRVVHEVDFDRLLRDIAAAIGLRGGIEQLGRRVWSLGILAPDAAQGTPTILTFAPCREELLSVAGAIAARLRNPFILLTPTDRLLSEPVRSLLRDCGAMHTTLESLLRIESSGLAVSSPLRNVAAYVDRSPVASIPIGFAPGTDATVDPLSQRAQEVLIAMLDLGAADSDRRQSTEAIAIRASDGDPNSLKGVISELRIRGLIETKIGRGGGCWLTPRGRARAASLRDQDGNSAPV